MVICAVDLGHCWKHIYMVCANWPPTQTLPHIGVWVKSTGFFHGEFGSEFLECC